MSERNSLKGLPADARAQLQKRAQPKWIAPMLATLTDEYFSRQGWLFEPKWDGERCLAFRSGRDLNLFSRNRIRLNAKYPEVVEGIYQQKTTSFVADGEIVTLEKGISSFAKLQPRMQVEHPPADLIRKAPVWFYLFDLLYLDRYDIRTWIATTSGRFRSDIESNYFAMPSISKAPCGSRNTARLKARSTTEGRARRDGKVSSRKMGTACTCPGERAIGSNSNASERRSSSSAVTAIHEGAGTVSEHYC
jgi:hypothetical protein